MGFPGGSDGKTSAWNAGDLSSTPGSERSPGEGNGYPLQCSCLENPHGQRSLVGYSPWGHKELDATEMTNIDHLTKYHKIIWWLKNHQHFCLTHLVGKTKPIPPFLGELSIVKDFFKWGIVALQCYVSFCCAMKWITYVWTYTTSLLDLPPRPHPDPQAHPSKSPQSTKLISLHNTAGSH